jgi:hypothetical protein
MPASKEKRFILMARFSVFKCITIKITAELLCGPLRLSVLAVNLFTRSKITSQDSALVLYEGIAALKMKCILSHEAPKEVTKFP